MMRGLTGKGNIHGKAFGVCLEDRGSFGLYPAFVGILLSL
jgi:hypothetical protein